MKKLLVVALPALLVCAPAVCEEVNTVAAPVVTQQAGARDGAVREYYDSGVLKSEASYTNGKKNGKVVEYYPTGVRKLELTYEDGVLDGTVRWYNPDGTVLVHGRAREGHLNTGSKYDANGVRTKMTDEEIAEYEAQIQ